MLFAGLDPGVNGGIAIVDNTGIVVRVSKMPATDQEVLDLFSWVPPRRTITRAVIERVSSSPQMGVVSAFTFGKGYGALRMALTANLIPYEEVTPRRWQSALGCLTKGDKNVSKARAQQLFPSIKVTHAIADALLLAEYCRRLEVRNAA